MTSQPPSPTPEAEPPRSPAADARDAGARPPADPAAADSSAVEQPAAEQPTPEAPAAEAAEAAETPATESSAAEAPAAEAAGSADAAEPAPVPAGGQRPRRLAVALVSTAAVLVLGSVGAIAFNQEFNEEEEKKPAGTTAVPAGFVLPALNGSGSVRLADLRGKPTVVNLFASWCDVCDLELPGFVRLSTELKGKVNFVGVDSMETGDKNLMAKRHDLSSWTLARDVGPRGSDFHDELAPGYGMPVTAFYDANGKLLKVHRGGLLEDDLRVSLTEVYGKL